ncbi:hypothetical protein EJ04DRAFT_22174 [Polyplosphaeria fusca]|uniref:LYR motif-containing protein Cup1-like N-terminal domain-containing protein n=1 Tax=Polyplosphaeria fusca TaxID=682080 RepID=A0A9P4QU37_9PLEO|nr:hypothetical protein EJ04DRAFT_22174 [Polyplosphaeria fusca]
MPRSLPYSTSSRQLLHLFRALLRETTYLPDPNARDFFRHHVVRRFKAYQPSPSRRQHRPTANIKWQDERARSMRRTAIKGLNLLKRANQGELPPLEKVLMFTYGRLGPRKYTLLNHLLKPEPLVSAHDEVAPLQKLYHSPWRLLALFDRPVPADTSTSKFNIDISDRHSRLRAVVRAQQGSRISWGREIKSTEVPMPATNAWQRPMPVKRARNIVRRWYAETMTRLMPPLPADEWAHLKGLATGISKWNGFVPRRSRQEGEDDHDTEGALQSMINEALALPTPSKAVKPRGIHRPHNLTPKFMQRMYKKIFALCCKTEWNDEFDKWDVSWGDLRTLRSTQPSTPADPSLFEGVDEKGKLATPSLLQ